MSNPPERGVALGIRRYHVVFWLRACLLRALAARIPLFESSAARNALCVERASTAGQLRARRQHPRQSSRKLCPQKSTGQMVQLSLSTPADRDSTRLNPFTTVTAPPDPCSREG